MIDRLLTRETLAARMARAAIIGAVPLAGMIAAALTGTDLP